MHKQTMWSRTHSWAHQNRRKKKFTPKFGDMEDIFTCNGPDNWLDEEGEETTDEGEMAGMVITPAEEDYPPLHQVV